MTAQRTLAIVGGSLAGAKAAEAARASGFDGRIVVVGDEPGAPYERPPLSKAILRGEADRASALVRDEGFYAEHDIELVHGRVTGLDPERRRVTLGGGEQIEFATAVLATGAAPRRLEVPGGALAGVHTLRTIDDAVELRGAFERSGRIAVIGAGWIGSEVAASARELGLDVVLVDPAPVPLQRVLGDEVGGIFRDLHAERGVDLRLGVGVAELRGANTVEAVVLDDGRVEPVDVVVAGVGVVPRTEVASAAGLHVDDGIVVDEHLESSVAGIFAAGDVARAWHPHYARHVRVEHWANAVNQGAVAGRNAVGGRDVSAKLPYFFSDQYDVGLEYVGLGMPGDDVLVLGDVGARKFVAYWHRDGIVTAAMHVNTWDVIDDLKASVAERRAVDTLRS